MLDANDCRSRGNEINGSVLTVESEPQRKRGHERTAAAYTRRCAEQEDQ